MGLIDILEKKSELEDSISTIKAEIKKIGNQFFQILIKETNDNLTYFFS